MIEGHVWQFAIEKVVLWPSARCEARLLASRAWNDRTKVWTWKNQQTPLSMLRRARAYHSAEARQHVHASSLWSALIHGLSSIRSNLCHFCAISQATCSKCSAPKLR